MMLPILDIDTAKKTILKRIPPNEQPVPQIVLDGIEDLFGEPLRPDQAVARILQEVRQDGDAALKRWTRRLDGANLEEFRVAQDRLVWFFSELDSCLKDD